MAKQQVVVPDIGGAEDAEVVELLVAVGDEVEDEQSLLVLESDKASMEIPSSGSGTVLELLVKEGDQLSEGAAILVLKPARKPGKPSKRHPQRRLRSLSMPGNRPPQQTRWPSRRILRLKILRQNRVMITLLVKR